MIGGVADRVSEGAGCAELDRFARAGALHRGAVDQQQIVSRAGAMVRERGDQRFDRVRQRFATLIESRRGQAASEQVALALARQRQKPRIRCGLP
jgi:hypothetical protein